MSPSRTALNGCLCFHSGCCGANALMRSIAKTNCVYMGCSAHRVPSLSKVAMRSGAGTKSGLPCVVVRLTKSVMAFFAEPLFHEGNGSWTTCCGGSCWHPTTMRRTNMLSMVGKSGLHRRIFVVLKNMDTDF